MTTLRARELAQELYTARCAVRRRKDEDPAAHQLFDETLDRVLIDVIRDAGGDPQAIPDVAVAFIDVLVAMTTLAFGATDAAAACLEDLRGDAPNEAWDRAVRWVIETFGQQ